VLVALAQDPIKALWVALAFFAIQQIENNLIVPKIQGDFLRLHPGVIIVLLVVAGALGNLIFVILVVPVASMVRDLYQYAYLRLGDLEPDEALDRSLGEYGANALRERLQLEHVVPAAELGNPGFGSETPPPPPPDRPPVKHVPAIGGTDSNGSAEPGAEVEPVEEHRRLRFIRGRKSSPTE
jgi:hypothetical protein